MFPISHAAGSTATFELFRFVKLCCCDVVACVFLERAGCLALARRLSSKRSAGLVAQKKRQRLGDVGSARTPSLFFFVLRCDRDRGSHSSMMRVVDDTEELKGPLQRSRTTPRPGPYRTAPHCAAPHLTGSRRLPPTRTAPHRRAPHRSPPHPRLSHNMYNPPPPSFPNAPGHRQRLQLFRQRPGRLVSGRPDCTR